MSGTLNLVVNLLGSDRLSGMFRGLIGTGKTASQVIKGMGRDAARLERELRGVRREIAGASGNVTSLVERERALERQISETNRQMERQRRLMAIDATADRMRARGEELRSRGRDNIVQGASLLAPFLLAGKAAGEFSSGMVDIQQKAELSDAATKRLELNILAAARAAKQMPEDMRSAIDVLSGKGLDPRQAALMVPSIGRLGTAFKVDLADGAAAAYANLKTLEVPIADTGKALDIMAASGNAGAFEIRDMARHFPALTAQMKAMGESGLSAVGNLSAALQIAERGTGNADQAANNIQNLLAKLNSPATIRAFQKNFGVDLPAAMEKARQQGLDTFEAIAMITDKATGGDLKKIGFAFEDMQAQGAIRSLIQNLKDYRKIRDDSMKATGTVDKAFDQRMLRDATVGWTAMKASVSELAITLGTTFLPVIVTTLGYVNSAASAVAAWAREHPKAASTVIQLVAGLAAFKIGLGALQFAFGGLLGPMATAYRFFARIRVGAIVGSRAFGLLVKGALGFGRAMLFVGRALLLNPIGLLVTALAVGAYLIWKHWDTIKKAFSTSLAFVKSIAARFIEGGRAIIDGLVAGIKAAPGRIWDALKAIVGGAWKKTKEFLGIASPSRLFATMGGHISQGLALGIDRDGRRPLASMRRLASGVAAAGALSLSPAMAGPPIAPAARAPAGSSPFAGIGKVEVNIYARDGQSAKEIAKEVKKELENMAGVKKRSSFEDDD